MNAAWEYKVIKPLKETLLDPNKIEGLLDSYGEDGWELVNAVKDSFNFGDMIFYLIRPYNKVSS
jgi:hypothetical protein